jgi:FAD/FMN-containing dehydrogenase
VRDAALAHSESQAAALWRLREAIPEAQFRNVKHDISVPVSQVPAFIDRASRALERLHPGIAIYAFGHIGDGNIHFNVGHGEPAANEALMRGRASVNEVVYDVVATLNGSISAEHGLGQLKREEIRRHKDLIELELMRGLKNVLDPKGIMNPGKVI